VADAWNDGKVTADALEPEFYCANYQLLRNVAYASPHAYVVFLLPRANETLSEGIELFRKVLLPAAKRQVRVIYLEEVLQSLVDMAPQLPPIVAAHQTMMMEKYLVPA